MISREEIERIIQQREQQAQNGVTVNTGSIARTTRVPSLTPQTSVPSLTQTSVQSPSQPTTTRVPGLTNSTTRSLLDSTVRQADIANMTGTPNTIPYASHGITRTPSARETASRTVGTVQNRRNQENATVVNRQGENTLLYGDLEERGQTINRANASNSVLGALNIVPTLFGGGDSLRREINSNQRAIDSARDFSDYSPEAVRDAYNLIDNSNIFQQNEGARQSLLGQGYDTSALASVRQAMTPQYNQSLREEVTNAVSEQGLGEIFARAYTPQNRLQTGAMVWGIGDDLLATNEQSSLRRALAHRLNVSGDELDSVAQSILGDLTTQASAELAEEHPVLASAGSLATNLVGGIAGGAYGLSSLVTGAPINPDSGAFTAQNMTNAVRSTVSEGIENPIARFAYNTGMSIGDSLLSQAAGGGVLGTAIMGTNAYSQAAQEGAERGLTQSQIQTTALASGMFEYLFEQISWDNITAIARGNASPNIIRNILTQAITEGGEELSTEFANTVTDVLVNGGASQLLQNAQQYESTGMTSQQAIAASLVDLAKQLGYSFLGGAASGGVMGGGASVVNNAGNIRNAINRNATTTETESTTIDPDAVSTARFVSRDRQTQAQPQNAQADDSGLGFVDVGGTTDTPSASFPSFSTALNAIDNIIATDSAKVAVMDNLKQAVQSYAQTRSEADMDRITQAAVTLDDSLRSDVQGYNGELVTTVDEMVSAIDQSRGDETQQILSDLQSGVRSIAEDIGLSRDNNNSAYLEESIQRPVRQSSTSPTTRTSQTATNTFRNSPMFRDVQSHLDTLDGSILARQFDYDVVSEKASIENAARMLEQDYTGKVEDLQTKEAYDGVDTDASMMVLQQHLDEARMTGDYQSVLDWSKVISEKIRASARGLQALAKYSRTAEGALIKGQTLKDRLVEDSTKRGSGRRTKENIEKTVNDILDELEELQRNADALTPFAEPGSGNVLIQQIRDALDRIARDNDIELPPNALDHFARRLSDGISQDNFNGELLDYEILGVYSLSEEEIDRVVDLYEQSQSFPDYSKQRADLLDEANAIIADHTTRASFMDKWNAWRYLSMLGNVKTHTRNMIGNVTFGMVEGVKNNVAATLESVAQTVNPNMQRTRSILNPATDRALIQAGREDAVNNVYSLLNGGHKYSITQAIVSNRRIFNNRLLESARKFNDSLLNKEDFAGLRNKYSTSLAGYLKANGRDTSIFDSTDPADVAFLTEARAFAINQAQIATFHEYSALASFLNETSERAKNIPVIGNAVNGFIEGVIPFKKTPINIAKNAYRYSPVSLLQDVTHMVQLIKDGERSGHTASDVIDEFSKTLTGTGVMALGWALASLGFIVGAPDDDDDQANFESLTGAQNYAIRIGDSYYTIDWLAPTSLPLFAGVQLQQDYENGEGVNLLDMAQSLADPMMEMSMLKGISDTLESARYSENAPLAIATDVATGYLTQGVPTLLGQVARSVDDTRRSTYTGETGTANQALRVLNTVENRVPGLSTTNQPYVDAWGNTQEQTGGNFIGRLAYNMLSPGYYSEQNLDSVEQELQTLSESTSDTSILPSNASYQITHYANGSSERIRLSPEEYTEYATQKGNLQHDILGQMFESDTYQSLSDDQKIDIIADVYSAAGSIAQNSMGYTTSNTKIYDLYNERGIDGVINQMLIKESAGSTDTASLVPVLRNRTDLSNEEKGYYLSSIKTLDGKKVNQAMSEMGYEGVYNYYDITYSADGDGNGTLKQAELVQYLDNLPLTMLNGEKAQWFDIFFPDAKTNPYR